jgi:hypothetical protein
MKTTRSEAIAKEIRRIRDDPELTNRYDGTINSRKVILKSLGEDPNDRDLLNKMNNWDFIGSGRTNDLSNYNTPERFESFLQVFFPLVTNKELVENPGAPGYTFDDIDQLLTGGRWMGSKAYRFDRRLDRTPKTVFIRRSESDKYGIVLGINLGTTGKPRTELYKYYIREDGYIIVEGRPYPTINEVFNLFVNTRKMKDSTVSSRFGPIPENKEQEEDWSRWLM